MLNIKFIHPKFFPTWILILLMRVGVFIPFSTQVIIGRTIGKVMYPFMSKLRSIAYSNISHCFPEKKQSQVNALYSSSARPILSNGGVSSSQDYIGLRIKDFRSGPATLTGSIRVWGRKTS